jgi:hypothetical protein
MLRAEGLRINRKHVQRLMRLMGIARLHQLELIFAIFEASDYDKPLVLKGRGLLNRL